jgi:hypothetical protein
MGESWIIPVSLMSSLIILFILIILYRNQKKKNIVKDLDITEINKLSEISKQTLPPQIINDLHQMDRIKNYVRNEKFQSSHQSENGPFKINDNLVTKLVMMNSGFQKITKNYTVNFSSRETEPQYGSMIQINIDKCEVQVV